MSQNIVIIPTYNEIENIEKIIHTVFSLNTPFSILVVDDNSPDGTAKKVEALQNQYKDKLFLEKRSKKNGLGTAYVHGFTWALHHSFEYIFEMDADFSHNPLDLEKLLLACKNNEGDVIVGSRYITGVNVVNWPLSRVLLSYFASIYVKIITGMKVHDATAGFICYKRGVLEKIGLENIKFVGYAFQIEMKYRAYAKGFKIKEVPIIFTERVNGVSKMSSAIIREAIFGVIFLKLKNIFNQL